MPDSLSSPLALRSQFPLKPQEQAFITEARRTIGDILLGKDRRLLLVIGPCSLHDMAAMEAYASQLQALQQEVSEFFFLVLRVYFEKPRTALGWEGFVYDPDLDGTYAITKGIRLTRSFLCRMAERKIPVGSEFVSLSLAPYFSDLVSWGCIGARTTLSPPHRHAASGFPFPVGFKNTVDGNYDLAIQGLSVAHASHAFVGTSLEGKPEIYKTSGNPLCHLVLRGGNGRSNYQRAWVMDAARKCRMASISNRLLIDCSHDNCNKQARQQIPVFQDVLTQILEKGMQETPIGGLMLESHLLEGTQPVSFPLTYGVSITDPCLGWEDTAALIRQSAAELSASLCSNVFC